MTGPSQIASRKRQSRIIATCGWLVIALSAGAALLPIVGPARGAIVIGAMLVLAGIFELAAGWQRRETRTLVMIAALATAMAGLLFATDPATHFLPALYIITGWLAVRAIAFMIAASLEHGRVRGWTLLSAITDAALAVLLMIGISIATVVVALFGATPSLVASFAWVLALSFVTTGLMLLEVAACARAEEV